MRSLLALTTLAAVVLGAAPSAGAKLGDSVVLVGADGRSFVQPLRPGMWSALGRLDAVEPPRAGYVLAYPLLRGGLPARPGRWYPRARIYCSGWRTGVEAGCGAIGEEVARRLAGGRGVPLFYRSPKTLARLWRAGVAQPVAGNVSAALELAFAQYAWSRAAGVPPGCVPFRAVWRGPRARARPTGFCVGRAGGVYTGGRVFALPPPTARAVLG